MKHHLRWVGGLALAIAASCTESGPGTEPGVGGSGGNNQSTCAYDHHDGIASAQPLQLGVTAEAAFVCPVGDNDFFSFELPAGKPLAQVDLAYASQAITEVDLSYAVLDETGKVVSPGASDTVNDKQSAIHNRERLEAGKRYFLRVSDVGNEDSDIRNGYTITVNAGEDSDNNEPNEDCASATALTTSETGAISTLGDHDAFAITVPAGAQIVDVTIQTPATQTGKAPTPVSLKATLSSGGKFLADLAGTRSADGSQLLHLRHGVKDAGTVCLVVEDQNGKFDLDALYTVAVQIAAEPDAQEQSQRNDVPAQATPVPATGGTVTGYLGSFGDVDWYRVPVPKDRVIQVEVSCPGCTGVEPTISLVYPHPDSTCDATSNCKFLLGTRACEKDGDCTSGACEPVPGGTKRCALGCNEEQNANLSCPGFECTATSADSDACAADAVCMGEGQCGALQFTRTAKVGETTVSTAQPTVGDATYVAVRDFGDDGSSASPYTLKITVYDDPDPNDRATQNNYYYPYTDDSEFEPVLVKGVAKATQIARVDADADGAGGAGPTSYTWTGSGCIGYETDVDIYHLQGSARPCGSVGPDTNCAMKLDFDRPTTPVKLGYSVVQGASNQRFSFSVDSEENGTFGDQGCGAGAECAFYYAGDGSDYNLVVRSVGQDAWDPDAAHCYHFTVWATTTPGCAQTTCPSKLGNGLCGCP